MLDHRRKQQDRQRQQQTDPEASLELRNHVAVIMACMARVNALRFVAPMGAIRGLVRQRMPMDARSVRTMVQFMVMLS